MAYDIYPSVNENMEFPPPVRQAQASSTENRATVQNFIQEIVPNLVAAVIAGDRVVYEAAIAALNDAMKTQDILVGSDVRAPKTISPDVRWAIPFTDKLGNVAAGITKTGQFATTQVPSLEGDFVRGNDNRSMIELAPDSVWAYVICDSDGNVMYGIKKDGTVFNPGDSTSDSRQNYIIKGHSLVRGYTGGTAWPIEDSWPSKLAALMPNKNVFNAGYGGQTIDSVRVLTGDKTLWVNSISGGAIPASGSVDVIVNEDIGVPLDRVNTFYGELSGVAGNLVRSETGQWTFTRSASGSVVLVNEETPLRRTLPYNRGVNVLWALRNDINFDVAGPEDTLLDHMKASYVDWVDGLIGKNPDFLIITELNRSAETSGTTGYETIVTINEWLKERFPGHVLDLRPWFVNQAIYDAGLTPTAEDLQAMSQDAPPPQIMDGGSHHIKALSPNVAQKVFAKLKSKGYA